MSHAVIRGSPNATQLAFDTLLDAAVVAVQGGVGGAEARARLSLPQVLLYCLKTHPEDLFMINADTGEKTTNQQLLSQVISLARKFLSRGVRGKVVLMVHDTHRTFLAVYLAIMFAGAIPYVMYNEYTAFETASFLELLQPGLVTCDARYYGLVTSVLDQLPNLNPEVLLDMEGLADEADFNSFQLPKVDPDDTAALVSTSGTTGLPKAVQLTHMGLVARLPWPHARPRSAEYPPDLALLTSSSKGVAFLRCMTSCLVNRIELLLPQTLPSAERLRDILLKYRPTMLTLVSLTVSALLPLTTADHFSSIRVLFPTGSLMSKKMIADIKEKLSTSALFYNAYGSAETHGGIAIGPAGEPLQFSNCVEYKLVDESGNEVRKGETGELYIKAPTLAKGYYNVPQREAFESGWYKTGDLFCEDGDSGLWFLERKAICFKFMGVHVSPEETEHVIESIEGVMACVVTSTEQGSAAAVVASSDVTRDMVHDTVKASLSKNKWLYGGVAFVPSLPVTATGKPQRTACKALLQQKIEAGECY